MDGRSGAAPRPAFAFGDAGIISNLLIIGGAHLRVRSDGPTVR